MSNVETRPLLFLKQLLNNGLSYENIALIFNITVRGVKKYEQASHLVKHYPKYF